MSGYSQGGASLSKKSLKTWRPLHLSAKSDIEKNHQTLRNRAADLAYNSALGSAIISTMTQGVIGSGLRVYPKVEGRLSKQIRREFELWAAQCDYLRRSNFYEIQRIVYEASLVDGDSFVLMRRRAPTPRNPYSLKLQAVEGLRVSNPLTEGALMNVVEMRRGRNRIINGIEVDEAGAQEAVWISNRVWNEPDYLGEGLAWQRVKWYGEETGCRNVLQICHDTRPDQARGVPFLAPVIESLKQMARYSEAELSAAIIRSFFSLFFKQPISNYDLNQITGQDLDVKDFTLSEPSVTALPRGVEVQTVNNSNSTSAFDSFFSAFIRQVGAACGLPFEVLLKHFQSSYSASRAALLQAEASFKIRRAGFINDFLKPTYELFMDEAVALGRLELPEYDWRRQEYLEAEWFGDRLGGIDELKAVNAARVRLELGLTTLEQEKIMLGVD